MKDPSSVEQRASRVKLLLMDCDGVLTDGRIWILENGDDQKAFNVRDGLGLELFHRAGLRSGIISGRTSSAVERRARGVGISFVRQGCINKVIAFDETLEEAGLSSREVAFVGDDLNDIPLMRRAGLSVAVADAALEARSSADYVTSANGGRGAIREVVEVILRSQGLWSSAIESFMGEAENDPVRNLSE